MFESLFGLISQTVVVLLHVCLRPGFEHSFVPAPFINSSSESGVTFLLEYRLSFRSNAVAVLLL